MVKQSFLLDPNAQSYTDDEIVGKVNAAAVAITRADAIDGTALGGVDTDDISEGAANKYDTGAPPSTTDDLTEGSTNKYDTGAPPTDLDALADGTTYKKMSATEQTKLGTIEDSATADQTGAEVRDLIVGIAEADRKIVISEPGSGEFKVIAVQRDATGKLKVEYDDVAEP